MPLREIKRIPDPISATFTIKEATAAHLILDVLVNASESGKVMPDGFDVVLVKRVCKELEKKLKRAGCVLDGFGWRI